MGLRWLFSLVFLAGMVAGIGFGLTAGAQSGGWFAAAAMSAIGLAWTAWGEGISHEPKSAEPAPAVSVPIVAPPGEPASVPAPEAPTVRPPDTTVFEEYFEQAPLPLVVMDRDGHIQRMNRAAEQVTEFATAEVRSQPYWNVFLAEAETALSEREYRRAMLERQAPVRREAWKTRTGAIAQFEWWRTILKDGYGQASGVLAAAMPVAEVSDPVDVPALTDQLTAVNGYAEFLLLAMDERDPIRSDLETIHRAGVAAKECLSLRAGVTA